MSRRRAGLMAIELVLAAFGSGALGGCGARPASNAKALPAGASSPSAAGPATPVAHADPLGPRPEVPPSPAFKPPTPTTYTTATGITVWLLERHGIPLVSVVLSVPTGSANDPAGRAGLAHVTSRMLDEGAGKRDSLQFARAVDVLGATISSSSNADASFVSLGVLKKNLAPALNLLGDAVMHPRFDAKDWRRVQDLWQNDLKMRSTEPEEVLRVVARAAIYGKDSPYGHPVDGLVASSGKITLEDAKRFYSAEFRPDVATLVAVGDVTRAELDPLIDQVFGTWKAPTTAKPAVVAPKAPESAQLRLVLVDRPEAPQSVIALVRPGLAAADADAAPLSRANTALGGSFTSRLNQDLREEHGWSYGAHSQVSADRGTGLVSASAAVVTEKTGEALKALLADVKQFAQEGLTDDEVKKTRSHARAELVEVYENNEASAARLAHIAAIGLPAGHDADASARRDSAGKRELDALAAKYFDGAAATIIAVGPKAKLLPQLQGLELPTPQIFDAEGNSVMTATPAPKTK